MCCSILLCKILYHILPSTICDIIVYILRYTAFNPNVQYVLIYKTI